VEAGVSLFFKRGEQRAMTSWFSTAADGPRNVTPETAVTLPSVYAALRHIIDFGSTLPIDTYRRDGDVRRKISPPQLISGLDAEGRPGSVTWVGQALYGMASIGNAVGWISEIDGFGFPTSVNWLRRDHWSFDEQSRQWYAYGQKVPASQLLHIPWIVPPGYVLGMSPLQIFIATVKAGLSAQEYSDIKRGGGVPPAVLKNAQRTLTPEEAEVVRGRAVTSFQRGEPFVTGNDWDLSLLTIPPNQAQFIETLKLTSSQVAAIFGVDPVEVGGEAPNSLTYATEEARQIKRAANVSPYVERIERAVSRVLPEKQYIKFNTDAKIRADVSTRTDIVGAQVADGRLSVNEARALEDRPPVPGGDAYNIGGSAPMTRRPASDTQPPVRQREGETP
jgi:HK97 family phage portal protein